MIIRCLGRVHGELIDPEDEDHYQFILEVKCRSNRCGAKAGVVVLHRFDLQTGKLIETKRYADPAKLFENKKAREVS